VKVLLVDAIKMAEAGLHGAACGHELKLKVNGGLTMSSLAALLNRYKPGGYCRVSFSRDRNDLLLISVRLRKYLEDIDRVGDLPLIIRFVRNFCSAVDICCLFRWQRVEKADGGVVYVHPRPMGNLAVLLRQVSEQIFPILPIDDEDEKRFNKVVACLHAAVDGDMPHTIGGVLGAGGEAAKVFASWALDTPSAVLMLESIRRGYANDFIHTWWRSVAYAGSSWASWGSGYHETLEMVSRYGSGNILIGVRDLFKEFDRGQTRTILELPGDWLYADEFSLNEERLMVRQLAARLILNRRMPENQELQRYVEQAYVLLKNPIPGFMDNVAMYLQSYSIAVSGWLKFLDKTVPVKHGAPYSCSLFSTNAVETRSEICQVRKKLAT
jgi:hypothetical protein